jgi:hypothetical protein
MSIFTTTTNLLSRNASLLFPSCALQVSMPPLNRSSSVVPPLDSGMEGKFKLTDCHVPNLANHHSEL